MSEGIGSFEDLEQRVASLSEKLTLLDETLKALATTKDLLSKAAGDLEAQRKHYEDIAKETRAEREAQINDRKVLNGLLEDAGDLGKRLDKQVKAAEGHVTDLHNQVKNLGELGDSVSRQVRDFAEKAEPRASQLVAELMSRLATERGQSLKKAEEGAVTAARRVDEQLGETGPIWGALTSYARELESSNRRSGLAIFLGVVAVLLGVGALIVAMAK
jgi:chromosome segregation ATPase